MIKELFPLIGDRAIFIKNLENYKKSTQTDQDQDQDQDLDDTRDDTRDDMQVSACLVHTYYYIFFLVQILVLNLNIGTKYSMAKKLSIRLIW